MSSINEQGSFPGDFVVFGDKLFFEATTLEYGREIWVSTGIKDHLSLLRDINPGNKSSLDHNLSNVSVILDGTFYFIAKDGTSNGELWKSDGTAEGTEKITDFLNYKVANLTLAGDQIFFIKPANGKMQVWKSDGTKSGTLVVRDDIPYLNKPMGEYKIGSTFLFILDYPNSSYARLWRSDGTAEGTYVLTNDDTDALGIGPISSNPLKQGIEYNGFFYNIVQSVSRFGYPTNVGLLKTDGTLAGTTYAEPLLDQNQQIDYADWLVFNNKLYISFFSADDKSLKIIEYNGFTARTLFEGSSLQYFVPSNLFGTENNLVFTGFNENGNTTLMKINVDNDSVSYIKVLHETVAEPFFFNQTEYCGKVLPVGDNQFMIICPLSYTQGSGWLSDLTESGTSNIELLNNILEPCIFNQHAYFSQSSTEEGYELWQYDGTEGSIALLENINHSATGFNNTTRLALLHDGLIFNASDEINGNELWAFKENQVNFLKDIFPGSGGSFPYNYYTLGDLTFFNAIDNVHDEELWVTDGTSEGTRLIVDYSPGFYDWGPQLLTEYKNAIYFIAQKEGHYHLARTSGVTIEEVLDLGTGDNSLLTGMKSCGDFLYFIDENTLPTLWISDGTAEGTHSLKEFHYCSELTTVNEKLYFTADEVYPVVNIELWTTDGTLEGTHMVRDIGTGYSSMPKFLEGFSNSLYFAAYTSENGIELWKSDGSEEGTVILADINPGPGSSILEETFCQVKDQLFFAATDGISGYELWKTDGTPGGTIKVKDINEGSEGSFPRHLVRVQDHVYFQAYDGHHGDELWRSDGTGEGTELVADVIPGFAGSNPSDIVNIADDIFFIAASPSDGRQLWTIPYYRLPTVNMGIASEKAFIFPNPAVDKAYINVHGLVRDVRIYNLQGRLMKNFQYSGYQLDVSSLPDGVYSVVIITNQVTAVRKLVKIH